MKRFFALDREEEGDFVERGTEGFKKAGSFFNVDVITGDVIEVEKFVECVVGNHGAEGMSDDGNF